MNLNIRESMDVISFSKVDLQIQVALLLDEGWEIYSGIDEVISSNDEGLSIITYSRTLVKKTEEL